MPKKFSSNLADICKKLINIDVNKRLGCLSGKSNDIRNHRWFDLIEWHNLYKQTYPSPFVPKYVHPLDIAFKNPNKLEEPLKITKINQFKKEFIDF